VVGGLIWIWFMLHWNTVMVVAYLLVWFVYSYFHEVWMGIHFHFDVLFLWLGWLYFVVQGVVYFSPTLYTSFNTVNTS
jgi:hypothetical protein